MDTDKHRWIRERIDDRAVEFENSISSEWQTVVTFRRFTRSYLCLSVSICGFQFMDAT